MLTRRQQILIKRAQAEAGLDDQEYRDTLQSLAGVRSSTDPRMTDRQFDVILAYLEAICWRGRDAGALPQPGRNAVFGARGYWARKNPSGNTSRDRFELTEVQAEIQDLEATLEQRGYHAPYRAAIRHQVLGPAAANPSVTDLAKYRCALRRTVAAKSKHGQPA